MGNAALGPQSHPRARGPRAGLAPLGSITHARPVGSRSIIIFPRFQQNPCTNNQSVISNTGLTGRAWKIPDRLGRKFVQAHRNLGNINTMRPAGQAWVILPVYSLLIPSHFIPSHFVPKNFLLGDLIPSHPIPSHLIPPLNEETPHPMAMSISSQVYSSGVCSSQVHSSQVYSSRVYSSQIHSSCPYAKRQPIPIQIHPKSFIPRIDNIPVK